uniref:Uncharacterized protein n=1 Tax=Anguilla anguilla TaxID=7936 RepID=A0A0E9S4C7_ANGAN
MITPLCQKLKKSNNPQPLKEGKTWDTLSQTKNDL